jgi:hypothetical protein
MNLEKSVTDGGFFYIRSISHDSAVRKLVIEFIKAPEVSSLAKRILTFTDIKDFSEELNWDEAEEVDADDGVINSLIGLDEYPDEEMVGYVVHTEVREMIFRTKEKPQIEDAW